MTTQNQNQKPTTIVTGGVRRPSWISSNVKQNVVFVRDKSGSMSGGKAKDAEAAGQELVTELARPENKDGFNVAIVDFASRSSVVQDLEQATKLDGKIPSLSTGLFGSTNLTAGLEDAYAVLTRAAGGNQDGVVFLRPVVIAFTDGCHNKGQGPETVAALLKGVADLVTVAFGRDADEALMRGLASSPQHYYRCSNGRELRQFLAAVGATMTATMAAGTNATQALTQIQQ